MSRHTELSRFSVSGKTFFFNKAVASNKSPYLAINALYGKGNQERIVLFEPHMLQFKRQLGEAVGDILGMQVRGEEEGLTASLDSNIPMTCPKCSVGPSRWSLAVFGERHFRVTCECGADVYSTHTEEG